jgi:carotenoid cleavage dioxygenase-like enzyme
MTDGYAKAFTTQERELDVESLPVSGEIPGWVRGSLLRTGPAKFEVGAQSYRHWFDGLAMLHRFAIADGRVAYRNRFLRSNAYTSAIREGRIVYSEFATDPCASLFARLKSFFSPLLTDNGCVNVVPDGDAWAALTETPLPVRFDPETLETLGVDGWREGMRPGITTAHPHFDLERREGVNYVAELGPRSSYALYAQAPGARERRRFASIPVKRPAYMHSFALTPRFACLVEFPLRVNPLRLAVGGRPFIENFRWKPEEGTRALLVDRRDGSVRATVQGEAFFAFHHANAFEEGDDLVMDVCAYDDPGIIELLYLDRLRAGERLPRPELRRYRLRAGASELEREPAAGPPLELPRVNYGRVNGRPYRYVFGIGTGEEGGLFGERLVKVDLDDGSVRTWRADGCFASEPVFCPEPGADAEDAGVCLSVALDAGTGRSFLLVLDGRSFEELARAEVPQHIPFGFHGQFAAASA